ncbi:MAG: hypothetical protein MJA84_10365, partial [Firmicutes bacterium]|nr:hypothetical protein [Bacillota bacterium]
YNLNKLEGPDTADLTQFNPNWDTLDTNLKQLFDDHVAHKAETVQNDVHDLKTLFQNQQFNNLVKNGHFNNWSLGSVNTWPDGWSGVGGDASNSFGRSGVDYLSKSYCAHLIKNAASSIMSLYQDIMDEAIVSRLIGEKITLVSRLKTTILTDVFCILQFKDSGGNNIKTKYSFPHTGSGLYERIAVTDTVPANTATIRVFGGYITSNAETGILSIDDVILVTGEIGPEFVNHPNDQHLKAVDFQDPVGGNYEYGLLKIQCGVTIITGVSPGTTGGKIVTFPTVFNKLLAIKVQIKTSTPNKFIAGFAVESTSGFDVYGYNGDLQLRDLTVHWQAVGVG